MTNYEPGAGIEYADVVIRPPNLFLGGLTASAILELFYPIGPGLLQGSWKPIVIGLVFAAAGAVIAWKAVDQFRNAGATVPINEPTEALVTNGLYGITRNPIYIGLIVTYFGVALALTSGWGLLLLPWLVVTLHTGVVLREEQFLRRKFGDAYASYLEAVPRWL